MGEAKSKISTLVAQTRHVSLTSYLDQESMARESSFDRFWEGILTHDLIESFAQILD
jgi:hypothetical protein